MRIILKYGSVFSVLAIWQGSEVASAGEASTKIQQILEQTRRDSEEQVYEWNQVGDSRSVWELPANELFRTSDQIFGRNPTASEVIGNFAAGRNGVEFNVAEQVFDRRSASSPLAGISREIIGEHTLIAQFENYKRSRRWTEAIRRFDRITKNRRIDSVPEAVRIIVADAYEILGNRKSQLRLLESVALNFPVSTASVISFNKITDIRCAKLKDPVYLSESFLHRLARQDVPDSGMRPFILSVLSDPIERRDGKIEVLSGVELLSFYTRAGFLQEAKSLGERLMLEGDHSPKEEMKLLLSLTKVYEDLSEVGNAVRTIHTYLEKFPMSPDRPAAVMQLGELLMKQTNYLGAATLFAGLKRYRLPRPPAWMEFFGRYAAKDYLGAELILRDTAHLGQLDPNNPGAREYWLARIWEQQNRVREAVSLYLSISKSHSLSYYAYAALARLSELSRSLDQSGALAWADTSSLPKGSTLHDAELVLASQTDATVAGVPPLQDESMRNPGGGRLSALIAQFETKDDVESFSSTFPRPYWERVRTVSERIGVDPLAMYSIMRAESRFRPSALSLVGAVGLLQIMPYTGSKIARLIGDEFYRAEELASPDLNISYGAFYFNLLHESFESLPLAIAAYNAGPRAVIKWVGEQKSPDMDLFIERIPFRETRKYVKEVLANLFVYERLYRGKVTFTEMHNMPSSLPDLNHLF